MRVYGGAIAGVFQFKDLGFKYPTVSSAIYDLAGFSTSTPVQRVQIQFLA